MYTGYKKIFEAIAVATQRKSPCVRVHHLTSCRENIVPIQARLPLVNCTSWFRQGNAHEMEKNTAHLGQQVVRQRFLHLENPSHKNKYTDYLGQQAFQQHFLHQDNPPRREESPARRKYTAHFGQQVVHWSFLRPHCSRVGTEGGNTKLS